MAAHWDDIHEPWQQVHQHPDQAEAGIRRGHIGVSHGSGDFTGVDVDVKVAKK